MMFFSQLPGQDAGNENMVEVMHALERRFNVVFTYLDEDVVNVRIKPPNQTLNLDQALNYLDSVTNLKFRRLDERFITVSVRERILRDLCGQIIDAETGSPLEQVILAFDDQVIVSDDQGNFQLKEVSEVSSITIRRIGYETTILSPSGFDGPDCQQIILKRRTTTLEPLTITNYVARGIDKRSDGSITLEPDQLGMLPGMTEPDVLYSIQSLPGILSINETVSDINVRGGTNDQNLVLWDGVRMFQNGHFFGLISAFNPYAIENIILIKNGSSARLGESVSSTIQLKTNDDGTSEFSGTIGTNMVNADAVFEIPVSEKLSLQLSGRRSFSDAFTTPTFNSYFNRAFRDTEVFETSRTLDDIEVDNRFYFVDGGFKVLYDISPKDKLRLGFLAIQNNIEYQENELLNGLVESRTSNLDQSSLAANLNYRRFWSTRFRTELLLYGSLYDLDAVNFDILNGQRLLQQNEILDLGAKLDTRFQLSDWFGLNSGYHFNEIGITNVEDLNNPDFRSLVTNVLRTHVIYSEGNYDSRSEKTSLTGGLRVNYFEKFSKLRVEPRLSLSQKISRDFSIELLGEMKSQSVTQVIDFQTDFLGIEKRRWILADDRDIPLERSKQVSLGMIFNRNNLLISAEGYWKDVNGITSSSQGFQNQFQFVRTSGGYNAIGLDFLVNWKNEKLNTWMSYSIADNTYNFGQLIPPEFANNLDIAHTVNYGVSYNWGSFELSSGLNFRTGKPFTEPDASVPVANSEINYFLPNSSRIGSYFRLDLSAKYTFKIADKVNGEIGTSVWNILDTDNIINIYYQLNSLEEVERIEQKALGVVPNINMRINF